jgi:hypothetical protein
VGYPSVMSFQHQLASGSQKICDLFPEFIERTYTNDSPFPSSLGPDLVNDEPSFGLFQFIVLDVGNTLLEFNSSKGLGADSVPPLILKNCASACFLLFACFSIGHWQRVSSPIE